MTSALNTSTGLRAEIEGFLYHEADLLDEWRLDSWIELFAPDAEWIVPVPGLAGEITDKTLYLIRDDPFILRHRVQGLLGKTAYAETPRSTTRRIIGNVRVSELETGDLRVRANFVLHRTHHGALSTYVGEYRHHLARGGPAGFLFLERRTVLDHDLRPQGTISFIL